ncbi:phage holin family protein [Pengzhenrongella frigida]|uniref:Phage holin family protein n=1 Tax=Pengzhenrongella frigida TaxID=1259133 RepID=A0A4Q5MZZ3_9MICO|nr:phage holin family protein [Cellulomonas sp. HLT2-17]RYV51442.1 phage holin family protein [Cellulomonas sp. HLT2-17]
MDDTQWTTPSSGSRPTVGELFSRLSAQTSDLVRAEIELAKAELAQKAKASGIGIGLFVGAAVLGFFALAVLITTAILALALAVPAWLAALIVAIVLLLVAGLLALVGKRSLDSASATPGRTAENVKQDVDAIKKGLRS